MPRQRDIGARQAAVSIRRVARCQTAESIARVWQHWFINGFDIDNANETNELVGDRVSMGQVSISGRLSNGSNEASSRGGRAGGPARCPAIHHRYEARGAKRLWRQCQANRCE